MMAEQREHPHLLLWYVSGDLEPRQARETEAHLARCDDCAAEARALSSMLEALRKHYPAGPPQAIRRPSPGAAQTGRFPMSARARRGLIAAAVVAASVVLLAVPAVLGRWVSGRPAPGIREIHAYTLAPPLRGPAPETVLPGPGPWALTIGLPFGASEGRYEARLERESGEAVSAGGTVVLTTDGQGYLTAVLESVPEAGTYRLVLRSMDHPGAPEASYTFAAAGR